MHNDQTITVLKALADPTRLNLVRELADNPALQKSCGSLSAEQALSQPAMSHHFAKLVNAGVVIEQKEGKQKSYKLNRQLLSDCGIVAEQL
jgi:ArsR family transcriptional regulator, arsenate/arsenite/antimonite-responsive transcriptional repressor